MLYPVIYNLKCGEKYLHFMRILIILPVIDFLGQKNAPIFTRNHIFRKKRKTFKKYIHFDKSSCLKLRKTN